MDAPVNIPVDTSKSHEDTEWNDILRKHGILPPKPPSPTPILEEAAVEALQRAHERRLEDKQLDELNELEDDEDEEFLDLYRKQRLEELSKIAQSSRYGQIYHLQKPDYTRDVTEASHRAFVLVHLTSSMGANAESRLLTEIWRELCQRFQDVKFCEIQADLCIEGYPDRNCPTILVYHEGEIVKQLLTLRELRGPKTTRQDVEKLLIELGAVQPNDPRLGKGGSNHARAHRSLSSNHEPEDEGDDDWD